MNRQTSPRGSVDPLDNDTQPELQKRGAHQPRARRPEPNAPVHNYEEGASIGRSADSKAGGAAGQLTPKD
ncbi:hypothetical protein QTH91_08275 [Variovorax dokdonensis]|uniref:Uncharacterized protein n=1 Tax=Variovorax dokdonensis TaxID=344883 RepID=A0ABT7N949_9BURK|nr:hypothetical protein [Variovorax dokdonensis]MDM0044471.1 hypothetical protein [Variovorax dokdonensis]